MPLCQALRFMFQAGIAPFSEIEKPKKGNQRGETQEGNQRRVTYDGNRRRETKEKILKKETKAGKFIKKQTKKGNWATVGAETGVR